MQDQKVATEVAEAEFDRFCEAMDLDVDVAKMDSEDRKAFDAAKRVVVRAIERGHLVVDEKGQPIYTPQTGNSGPITFYEPTGATFMAMDAKKRGQDVGKSMSMLADITRRDAKTFAVMPNRDLKVCSTLMNLFLG